VEARGLATLLLLLGVLVAVEQTEAAGVPELPAKEALAEIQ
jgi:hypothetical protein